MFGYSFDVIYTYKNLRLWRGVEVILFAASLHDLRYSLYVYFVIRSVRQNTEQTDSWSHSNVTSISS